MIKAAMDLGSNTLRLLVARVEDGQWTALDRGLAAPRLGRGLAPGGWFHPDSKALAQSRAAEFAALARRHGAQGIVLAATEACRRAKDGPDFVAKLGRDLGLDRAEIIDGRQEARLSRLGVVSRLSQSPAGALLADVGGGSTELIDLGPTDPPAQSLPLGAVAISEAFLLGDPPTPAELARADAEVDRVLARTALPPADSLVATAGTAASLAALHLGLASYQPEEINNLSISRHTLEDQSARLAALPLAQRRRLMRLEPGRADIILGGLAVLRGLLRATSLDRLTLMDAGLLEGILLGF